MGSDGIVEAAEAYQGVAKVAVEEPIDLRRHPVREFGLEGEFSRDFGNIAVTCEADEVVDVGADLAWRVSVRPTDSGHSLQSGLCFDNEGDTADRTRPVRLPVPTSEVDRVVRSGLGPQPKLVERRENSTSRSSEGWCTLTTTPVSCFLRRKQQTPLLKALRIHMAKARVSQPPKT